MIGTGLLWSPYSFRCGVVMSVVVNIICAILSMIGIFIQFDIAAKIREYTFDKIWSSIFGPAYKVLPDVLLLFSSIGTTIVQMNLIIQALRSIVGPISTEEPRFYLNSIFLCFIIFVIGILPFCLLKNVKYIIYPSQAGLMLVIIFLIYYLYIFIGFSIDRKGIDPEKQLKLIDCDFILICFKHSFLSYHYQPIVLPIVNEMNYPKKKSLIYSSWSVIFTGFMVYLTCGLLGYLTLYDINQGHIFLVYFTGEKPYFTGSAIFNFVMIIISILNFICSMPTYFFAANESIYTLFSLHPSLEWWIPPLIRAGFGLSCALLASIEGTLFTVGLFVSNVAIMTLSYIVIPIFYLYANIEKSKPLQGYCIFILIASAAFFIIIIYDAAMPI